VIEYTILKLIYNKRIFLFNSDNNTEETGFADAYKSQILNPDDEDDTTSKNLIIILLLVAIIIGLSIFGYIYMSKTTQTQSQENIDKKEVKAIEEVKEEEIEPPKSQMLNNIDELEENSEPMDTKGIDLPKEVENIKIDEKPETKEVKQEPKQKDEETYLEQLADLSKEIDGEIKKK